MMYVRFFSSWRPCRLEAGACRQEKLSRVPSLQRPKCKKPAVWPHPSAFLSRFEDQAQVRIENTVSISKASRLGGKSNIESASGPSLHPQTPHNVSDNFGAPSIATVRKTLVHERRTTVILEQIPSRNVNSRPEMYHGTD